MLQAKPLNASDNTTYAQIVSEVILTLDSRPNVRRRYSHKNTFSGLTGRRAESFGDQLSFTAIP